jgi:hypothetical protein
MELRYPSESEIARLAKAIGLHELEGGKPGWDEPDANRDPASAKPPRWPWQRWREQRRAGR